MLQMLIFHGAYAFFPFLAVAVLAIAQGGKVVRWLAILALIPACILAWSRFVEPAILNVKRAEIVLDGASTQSDPIQVALFADTHFGTFENAMPMARIVRAVNREKVDLVLIAGDLVYKADAGQIETEIAQLAEIDAPVFAILGNHDVGAPGRDRRDEVRAAFAAIDLPLLEDEVRTVTVRGRKVLVSGLRDLWDGPNINTAFAEDLPGALPHLTLAHNPDTAMFLDAAFDYDLMLSGHTHGGQIRLPFLYKAAIPTDGQWDKDLHIWRDAGGVDRKVWVTSGTGMVGLPMRFLQPPRIDVLTVYLPEPS